MIQMMLNYLSTIKKDSRVVLEVKKDNRRAISSYKKCVFTEIKELNEELYLMEWVK